MGLCRLLIYVSVGFCFAVVLPLPLLIGAVLLFSYLIGLTYVAKQENLGEVKNLWPMLFLAAPVIYGGVLSSEAWPTLAYWVIFVVAMVAALWLVRRRQSGDIPRAVVSLIAGMSLLDAILISGAGEPGLALFASTWVCTDPRPAASGQRHLIFNRRRSLARPENVVQSQSLEIDCINMAVRHQI